MMTDDAERLRARDILAAETESDRWRRVLAFEKDDVQADPRGLRPSCSCAACRAMTPSARRSSISRLNT
jgi:hypothetical protein